MASSAVKAVVEEASYDSSGHQIDFEVWVPVKAGTMEKYKFAWPAAITDTFPTPDDSAGGGGIGAGATGELPIGYTDGINSGGTVFVGGPNVVFLSQSDRGDRTPGDTGFTAQTIIPPNVFAEIDNTPNPNPDLTLNYVDPLPVPTNPITTTTGGGVDTSLLETFFFIEDGVLKMRTDAKISDGETEAPFDFEYDAESEKFGAGTAFLYEESP